VEQRFKLHQNFRLEEDIDILLEEVIKLSKEEILDFKNKIFIVLNQDEKNYS